MSLPNTDHEPGVAVLEGAECVTEKKSCTWRERKRRRESYKINIAKVFCDVPKKVVLNSYLKTASGKCFHLPVLSVFCKMVLLHLSSVLFMKGN